MQSGGSKNIQLPPPGADGYQLNGESSNYTPGRIHVSRLPKNITTDDLRVHFSYQFGHVVETYVVNSNYKYNFGFVAFADPADVDRLMGENSSVIQIINGTTVIIKRAWADHHPASRSKTNRGGDHGSDSRGGGDDGSSRGVRSDITLGDYLMPALHAFLNNNGGENSQGGSSDTIIIASTTISQEGEEEEEL